MSENLIQDAQDPQANPEVTSSLTALKGGLQEGTPVIAEQSSKEQQLSKRDFEIAMRKYQKERSEKLKENKRMVEEMNLEVAYWKAQADLLRYRFEKMDFYIKNLELEPVYLQRLEEQRIKEEQSTNPVSSILS